LHFLQKPFCTLLPYLSNFNLHAHTLPFLHTAARVYQKGALHIAASCGTRTRRPHLAHAALRTAHAEEIKRARGGVMHAPPASRASGSQRTLKQKENACKRAGVSNSAGKQAAQ